jgi:hypothetical protein
MLLMMCIIIISIIVVNTAHHHHGIPHGRCLPHPKTQLFFIIIIKIIIMIIIIRFAKYENGFTLLPLEIEAEAKAYSR